MATSVRCPICGRPAAPRQENRSFPFCGDHCRLLDLGKWFDGAYRVPGPLLGDGAEEDAPDLAERAAEDEG